MGPRKNFDGGELLEEVSSTVEKSWDQIRTILSGLDVNQRSEIRDRFDQWLRSSNGCRDGGTEAVDVSEKLDEVASFLREKLPLNALMPSEQIITPTCGENADCDPETTIHVDAFLYPDEEIDRLCEEGTLSLHYCGDCGSRNVHPLTIISHSASKSRAISIFDRILQPKTLENATILDIGSRLGVLCYAACWMTSTAKVIGIELNAELCDLQREVVERFDLGDRMEVVQADILARPDLLEQAKVVMINNSFEFFSDVEKQRQIWSFIARHCQPGCRLVTVPSLKEALESIKMPIDLSSWVSEVPTSGSLSCSAHDEELYAELEEVHLYEVLRQPN